MRLFGTSNPPTVEEAQQQVASLTTALGETKARLARQQQAREATANKIATLKAQAAVMSGEDAAERLNKAEVLTREGLLLAAQEIDTQQRAAKLLEGQLAEAQEALGRALWQEKYDELSRLLAEFDKTKGLLEERAAQLGGLVAKCGELTSLIEPRMARLRHEGQPFGLDAPGFNREPIVGRLREAVTKQWNDGVSKGEHATVQATIAASEAAGPLAMPIAGPDEEVVEDAGHQWAIAVLPEAQGTCSFDGQCHEPAVSKLTYRAPQQSDRHWRACQAHADQFRARHFTPARLRAVG